MASYWYADSHDAERWHPVKDATTLEEAIKQARWADGGEIGEGAPFVVADANQQAWRFSCFDDVADQFDSSNEELGDMDGDPTPAVHAGVAKMAGGPPLTALKVHLEAALEAWVRANGNPMAWALQFNTYHDVPATAAWHAAEQAVGPDTT